MSEKEEFVPLCSSEEIEAIDKFYRKEEPWIQTFSGKRFNFLNINPDDILIEDIAHSLSLQCRFTGHSKFHYSIAQHSVLVSYLCDAKYSKYGLMHDCAEYVIADLSAPAKRIPSLSTYKDLEKKIQSIIYSKFGMDYEEEKNVKDADILALHIEAETLMTPKHKDWKGPSVLPPVSIIKMTSEQAEELFLKRFNELFNGK